MIKHNEKNSEDDAVSELFSGEEDEGQDSFRLTGKRRSKHDCTGRNFMCKYCDKTYLSYPALYTHMKQKHSKGPDGEMRNPPTSGRGRGRPRKNPFQRLDPRTEDFFKHFEREGGPVDPLCCFEKVFNVVFQEEKQTMNQEQFEQKMYCYPIFRHLVQFSDLLDNNGRFIKQNLEKSTVKLSDSQKKKNSDFEDKNQVIIYNENYEGGEDDEDGEQELENSSSDEFLNRLNCKKNNNQNLKQLNNPYQLIDNQNQFVDLKNYNILQNFNNNNYQNGILDHNQALYYPKDPQNVMHNNQMQTNDYLPYFPVEEVSVNKTKWQRNYDKLSENDRQEMLVDEIFALYLYRMSNKTNENFYQTILFYILFFRECLNEYGWGKKIESENIKLEEVPNLKHKILNYEFCDQNDAEHAPEICNEFVTVYLDFKKDLFYIPKQDQIDLTVNFCHWLFQCQFTCSKLTIIS